MLPAVKAAFLGEGLTASRCSPENAHSFRKPTDRHTVTGMTTVAFVAPSPGAGWLLQDFDAHHNLGKEGTLPTMFY
jgi:hypothetical protein